MERKRRARRIICSLLVAVLLLPPSFLAGAVQAGGTIVINSGRKEPFCNSEGTGFYNLLVEEIFRRLGMEAETVRLPSERALINANEGIDDGNIARIEGIEKKYTNLIRVPEKVVDFEFMVFTGGRSFAVTGWDSLRPYVVGIITGWKILERNVTGVRGLTKVKNPNQLFKLLENNRADAVVFDRWGGLWWIRGHDINVRLLEPPLAKRKMYIYMNKKHRDLVPQIARALRNMKRDGTYQGIYDKTLSPLLGNGR